MGVIATGSMLVSGYTAGLRAGAILSDGSYVFVSDNGHVWHTTDKENWTDKLTLSSTSNGDQEVWVVGDSIYVVRAIGSGYYVYFWVVTYTPATESFSSSAAVTIDLDTTDSLYPTIFGVFPTTTSRMLAAYYDASAGDVDVEYSTNSGSTWTLMTGDAGTADAGGRFFARAGDDTLVLLNWSIGGSSSIAARVYTNSAVANPTAVTWSHGISTARPIVGQNPTTGDIYAFVWDNTNKRFKYNVFDADTDTWGTAAYLTPAAAYIPAGLITNSALRGGFLYSNSKPTLVYSGASTSNDKICAILDLDDSTAMVVATIGAHTLNVIPNEDPTDTEVMMLWEKATVTYTTNSLLWSTNLPPVVTLTPEPDFDARDIARLEWTFADPDGEDQNSFKLRIRRKESADAWQYAQSDGTLGSEAWVTSANAYWDMDADELANYSEYEWQVMARDEGLVESEWSALGYLYPSKPMSLAQLKPSHGAYEGRSTINLSAQYLHRAATSGTVRFEASVNPDMSSAEYSEVAATDEQVVSAAISIAGRGLRYWRVRAQVGTDYAPWSEIRTLTRTDASAELISPTPPTADVDTVPYVIQAKAYSDDSTRVRILLQLDILPGFNSASLIEERSGYADSGTLQEFSRTYTGTQLYYARVLAEREP